MAENTFVIRIWFEHSERELIKPQLRGVIEHVVSGQRQYITNTQGINQFIQSYLPVTSRKSTEKLHSINQWIDQESQ